MHLAAAGLSRSRVLTRGDKAASGNLHPEAALIISKLAEPALSAADDNGPITRGSALAVIVAVFGRVGDKSPRITRMARKWPSAWRNLHLSAAGYGGLRLDNVVPLRLRRARPASLSPRRFAGAAEYARDNRHAGDDDLLSMPVASTRACAMSALRAARAPNRHIAGGEKLLPSSEWREMPMLLSATSLFRAGVGQLNNRGEAWPPADDPVFGHVNRMASTTFAPEIGGVIIRHLHRGSRWRRFNSPHCEAVHFVICRCFFSNGMCRNVSPCRRRKRRGSAR